MLLLSAVLIVDKFGQDKDDQSDDCENQGEINQPFRRAIAELILAQSGLIHIHNHGVGRSTQLIHHGVYAVDQHDRTDLTFVVSLVFVAVLFLTYTGNIERIMFWAFLVGNILYYLIGIILAFAFKDNRAFCKYICPITVFLKPMSYFSLSRITCNKEKCVSCGKCKAVCPMDVDITDNARSRKNGTECILCMECVKACPKKAL